MKFGLLSKFSAFFILVFFSLDSADGAADIARLARTTPKQALQWRRTREVALHQAPDRWSMWPLILPDALATWCLAADDAKGEAN